MEKAIRMMIAGKEYSLRADDEITLKLAADLVNQSIDNLESNHPDESYTTLSILAALNIAEQFYNVQNQNKRDIEYLNGEITQMVEYLTSALDN